MVRQLLSNGRKSLKGPIKLIPIIAQELSAGAQAVSLTRPRSITFSREVALKTFLSFVILKILPILLSNSDLGRENMRLANLDNVVLLKIT